MITSMAVTFGELLKQLRKRRGMTQADLAAAVGYSVPFISNLELNQRLPNVEVIAQHFVPALGLQEDPHLAARLVALAAAARGALPPADHGQHEPHAAIVEAQEAHPRSWPASPTELVGRAHAVKMICNRLLGHSGRLLTLVGPAGIGKTRLGLAVADKLRWVFADGVYFVPLAAVSDPDLVAPTLIAELGIGESKTRAPKDRLIDFLRRKEAL